jgi:hypothetical protein
MHAFCSNTLVGPTKVSIMKLKHTMLNRMWQHDFWMMPKNFEFRYPHRQTSMKATIPDTPGSNLEGGGVRKSGKQTFVTY